MRHDNIIASKRIKLRQVKSEDLEYLINWRNDENIRKWFFDKKTITLDQQKEWYKRYLENDKDIMFTIEEVSQIGRPIGTVSLYNIDYSKRIAEFGRFMIGEYTARGKGFGIECVNAVCSFGINDLKLKKIYLEVIEDNRSAINTYIKSGFRIINDYVKDGVKVLYMELSHGENWGDKNDYIKNSIIRWNNNKEYNNR